MESPAKSTWVKRVAQVLPGLLLLVTVFDDAVFGSLIVGARVAYGAVGLLLASAGFVVLSVLLAAATAWSMRTVPINLSAKMRHRLAALRDGRFGRFLVPQRRQPVTTAAAAAIFGSVAPVVIAEIDRPDEPRTAPTSLVVVSGVGYGLVFAAGYGLLGMVVGVFA